MKRFEIFILLLTSLFIYTCVVRAEFKSRVKSYSILGDSKNEVYEQFDKYNMSYNIESIEPSGAIISQEDISSKFKEELPEAVEEIAGQEILDYLNRAKFENMRYSTDKWNKKNVKFPSIVKSTSIYQDTPLGVVAKLPLESKLSISGRKLIGFDYTSRVYDKEEDGKRKNTSFFKMEQELQMRVKGSVGDRLDVNIDYDDTANKKDISLVYKGQPGEFVQEAAFGDISVSLPTTEFTQYSKELFGLKVDTRYKTLGVNAFFSKTKGLSEVKRFTGNTQLERRTIADTSYIKRRYYSLLASGEQKKIRKGTVEVFVDYKDNRNAKDNIEIDTDTSLNDLNRTGTTYTGKFVRCVSERDYTVDYNTGIIAFKNTLVNNYIVAVNYEFEDGSKLGGDNNPLIIKDTDNTTGVTTELKTFYDLGNLNITRDNGRGNFILEIKDLNGSTPSTIIDGKSVPVYPLQVGYDANINVDFEKGVFNLSQPLHDTLYSSEHGEHEYNFITEYQYAIKILTLRPGIVPQSEKVVVDGVTLKSGKDYILDYDVGILTITDENIIKETSILDISYDYSLFGSEAESTLVGASSRLDLTNNISLGTSILYNFMAKGTVLPDIRNVPTSLTVGEGDIKITDLDIDTLNMKINAEAEYALSAQNINTSGKASIDSMDNSVCEDLASVLNENWFHSADDKNVTRRNLSDLSWKSYEIYLRDIDPSLELVEGQKQLVLEINYDVNYRTQIAFAQKLSSAGYDFSRKLYVDIWILDNNLSSPEFIIDYASSINEDSDGNGQLDTEDTDGTGILSPWKDTGRPFHNVDGTVSYIGAHNGKLDTEDLNGNGILDTTEDIAGTCYISSGTVIKTSENGWKQLRIPLKIIEADREKWKNVRILRFKVKQKPGKHDKGKIVIGKIAIIGNKWMKTGENLEDFSISTIGKYDPEYKSILSSKYYLDLYDIDNSVKKDEKALKIAYKTTAIGKTFLAKSVYTGDSLDISKYESIRFMVYAKPDADYAAVGDVLIFRAGGNDNNYFEYRVQVTTDSSWQDWKLITIKQEGFGRAASWSRSDPNVRIIGEPSLDKISQFVVGVESAESGIEHQIWFKEIHVVGSKILNGSAWKASGGLQWNGTDTIGYVSAGVSRKTIDRNFQTITAGVYNRDYLEDNAYFNFGGLKMQNINVLPIKTGISRIETIMPKVADNTNLISLNEEGQVITYTGYAETNLNLGVDFPQLSTKYSRSIIDTSQIKRLEDKEILSGTIVYNNPLEFILLPSNITADAKTANSYYKIYPSTLVAMSNSFLGLDRIKNYLDINKYHTLEQSNMLQLKLPFKFSQGISFSPSYIIDVVKEKNNDFPQEIEYDKSLKQTVGASLVLGLVNWFSPSFIYSINTKENYDVNASTKSESFLIPGQKKHITREGIGEISWNLNAYDITSSPFFKSLTFSTYYKLHDSDSYDKVNKDFKSIGFAMDKLWVRSNPLMDLQPFYSSNSYVVQTVANRNDIHFSGKYMPFEAFDFSERFSSLNTVSANFTYTEGSESYYGEKDPKNVYSRVWPEMLIGMSGVERFFGVVKYMTDTQLNFKYHNKNITTYGHSYSINIMYGVDYRFKIFQKIDLYCALENTDSNEFEYLTSKTMSNGLSKKYVWQGAFDLGKWRFSLRYENEKMWQKNCLGWYYSGVDKNTYLGQISSDMIFPSGLKIPIINKVLPLKNRIIFLSKFKYIDHKSEVNVGKDNNTNYGVSANADYEISKYFRFLIGFIYDRFEYRYIPESNYYDISLVSKLTIQF
ncbi:MAG: hypothetical protein LBT18_02840 [Endomicrobium sp.]|jgi:hypothetical protein|nr:hypothetical protein [Endomicrobium sp.]